MNSKELLISVIIIFLSITAWIAFDIYHASSSTSLTPVQLEQTKPLTPTFDGAIIEKIKSRER
ncbi:hypothetical protein HY407_03310 [Candidatus Gottesmanbacteria bacterium]|nr:hypothetical protein [Candidatus Gottesmanbacteria bacterium]